MEGEEGGGGAAENESRMRMPQIISHVIQDLFKYHGPTFDTILRYSTYIYISIHTKWLAVSTRLAEVGRWRRFCFLVGPAACCSSCSPSSLSARVDHDEGAT